MNWTFWSFFAVSAAVILLMVWKLLKFRREFPAKLRESMEENDVPPEICDAMMQAYHTGRSFSAYRDENGKIHVEFFGEEEEK